VQAVHTAKTKPCSPSGWRLLLLCLCSAACHLPSLHLASPVVLQHAQHASDVHAHLLVQIWRRCDAGGKLQIGICQIACCCLEVWRGKRRAVGLQ
jgi:hypothetical protein